LTGTFVELVNLYERHGFTVQTSLSPAHFPGFGLADIPFTYIYKDNVRMSKGGGIALAEIYFLENLTAARPPKNIFVIGNAFGWSTLALALMCPGAKIVAIDWCPRPDEEEGLAVTNDLAREFEADVIALKGKSPVDVPEIVKKHFRDPVDFVLIDGGHTSEHQNLDFDACKGIASSDCVYVFHDVINFGMVDGFVDIARANPHLISSLLFRTPSGMAVSYPTELDAELGPVVNAFTENNERVQTLHQEGRERRREQS